MKVHVSEEEIYPVLYVYREDDPDRALMAGPVREVPDDLIMRYEKALDEFWSVHAELEEYLENKT